MIYYSTNQHFVLQVDNPLEQAIKFLKPLQVLATDRIDTHICAYEIYSRKGEFDDLLKGIILTL